jgi:glycosyltransferase involved in cell wall biosynthesis
MSISVLLPTYNNSKFIFAAVKSILEQTYKNFELLIIDDGSTDNTVEVIKSFKDSRIRLICHDKNQGLGGTLNHGLELSEYALVARMDGDDISLPERLECQLEYLRKNPRVDILSCRYAVLVNNKIRYFFDAPEHHAEIKKRLALHSEIIHSGVIYKKETILSLEGYKNIPIEDFELWLRIKDKMVFGNVPQILLIKRYHDEAISQQLEIKCRSAYEYLEPYYYNLQTEFGIKNSFLYKGWREYFYGNKKKAMMYFLKLKFHLFYHPKVFVALLFTYLGENQFIYMKELRLRFRINYYLRYFQRDLRKIRIFLKYFTEIQG